MERDACDSLREKKRRYAIVLIFANRSLATFTIPFINNNTQNLFWDFVYFCSSVNHIGYVFQRLPDYFLFGRISI